MLTALRGQNLPAICDLRGDFQKLQGEPILLAVKFSNGFNGQHKEQGEVLASQGRFWELQGRAAWNCEWWQGLAQIPLRTRRPHNSIGSQADVEDRKQARRERVGSRPRRLPNLSASRSKGHLPGGGIRRLSCKPCGGQPLTGRAAIACVDARRISRTCRTRVRYGGTPPEHILAADCRDDLASAASPPACPFLGCRRCGVHYSR
jgi:hypothetical protein